MSLPRLDPQRSFFETEEVFARLGKAGGAERFRFFAERIWPQLVRRRPELEKMYCADNGRPAEEPVRMLSVLILQFMERMPDRQAAEACQYDLRWKLALGMEVDEPAFHATSLVKFRDRLLAHGLERLGFEAVLEEMRAAGLFAQAYETAVGLDAHHRAGQPDELAGMCARDVAAGVGGTGRGGDVAAARGVDALVEAVRGEQGGLQEFGRTLAAEDEPGGAGCVGTAELGERSGRRVSGGRSGAVVATRV